MGEQTAAEASEAGITGEGMDGGGRALPRLNEAWKQEHRERRRGEESRKHQQGLFKSF
jgi:hypothetical protein